MFITITVHGLVKNKFGSFDLPTGKMVSLITLGRAAVDGGPEFVAKAASDRPGRVHDPHDVLSHKSVQTFLFCTILDC